MLKPAAVRRPDGGGFDNSFFMHGHRLGNLKGKIRIADDFDAPLPEEILDAFGCNR